MNKIIITNRYPVINHLLIQGCHSHKISKFLDFSLTYLHFFMNFPDFQQNSKFPWLILEFPDFSLTLNFPDFSLTSGNPVIVQNSKW